MKKLLGLAAITSIIAIGCLKNDPTPPCTPKTVDSEKEVMNKFATDSAIITTTDANGIMYQIMEEGTGATPTTSSTVTVKYVGRLLNGKGFDSSYVNNPEGLALPLNGVITGWQLGIPKIKAGGKIKMIIPSSLAYGCVGAFDRNGMVVIPRDQPLYFYVELVAVK